MIISKRHLALYLCFALLLVSLAFGVSYAYFTLTVTGNDSVNETRITTGTLSINYSYGDTINNSNIMLIDDTDKLTRAESISFSITNTSANLNGAYLVYLDDLTISNNLKSTDFKWELVKNGTATFAGDFSTAVTGTPLTLTSMALTNGTLSPIPQTISYGNTDNLVLRIWLSKTQADQNALLGGSFSAKVRMIASQVTSS